MSTKYNIIRLRRGTAAEWAASEPQPGGEVLKLGEPGYEKDTGKLKIGDGVTSWNSLAYFAGGSSLTIEEVQDNLGTSFLVEGTGVDLNYNDANDILTISVSGLDSSNISDFDSAVQDNFNTSLVASTGIVFNYDGGSETLSIGISGNYIESEITTLLVAGSGIDLTYNSGLDTLTISTTETINNYSNNRILTSDGTQTGIDAESNLTFDGALLSVSGDLIANTGTLHILQLDTNNGSVSAQGQFGWNTTQGTVDLALTSTAVIEVGEHQMYRIRNTTSNTLYRGQPVYASGVHANGLITPNLYLSDNSIDEIRFIGLMYETVDNNNNGYVIAFGHMYHIDTRGNVASDIAVGDETWANGDILYPHPTVAGKLTKVAPKHYVPIALILDAANNGKIYVRRDLGAGELNDLHNVNVSGVINNDVLVYNSGTDYWEPSNIGQINFGSIPTSDPLIAGRIWVDTLNGNVLKVSTFGS